MTMMNWTLIVLPTLIWGSTWFVIKFQIGQVDPMVSVFYRFALAGMIMLVYCWIKKKKLNFPIAIHGKLAIKGLLLFGVNYWLIYIAEQYLTSGLIAVIFSLIVFLILFLGDFSCIDQSTGQFYWQLVWVWLE